MEWYNIQIYIYIYIYIIPNSFYEVGIHYICGRYLDRKNSYGVN